MVIAYCRLSIASFCAHKPGDEGRHRALGQSAMPSFIASFVRTVASLGADSGCGFWVPLLARRTQSCLG